MDEIKETGGARIGMVNSTWPFATLTVNANKLQLSASMIGSLVFRPSDVISITPYVIIPFLGQGIQIRHTVAAYNAKVIFWTMGSPEALIGRIEQTGFLNHTQVISPVLDAEVAALQSSGGFPMKVPAAIAIVVIWNLILLPEFINFNSRKGVHFGVNVRIALGFFFFTALFTLISEPFRKLILKPGRTVADVRSFLLFLMFITGVMFIAFSLIPFN